jgi:hypothetical protein
LPSKEEYPDYYKIIDSPIAFDTIKERIENDDYESSADMREDIEIMAGNAMSYNRKGSVVYKDATNLIPLFDEWMDACEFLNLISKKAKPFIKELSAKISQETIKSLDKCQPSLKSIQDKLSLKEYTSPAEFEDDIESMVASLRKNAKQDQQKLDDATFILNLMNEGEDDPDPDANSSKPEGGPLEFLEIGKTVYFPGDFVYISNHENPKMPKIVQLHNVWSSSNRCLLLI